MRIAIVGAGFTPAEADKLRRAMATFRHSGKIGYFREKFIAGMVKNAYPRDFAERCFHQIEGFGEYGFPESHAASFALLVCLSVAVIQTIFAGALLQNVGGDTVPVLALSYSAGAWLDMRRSLAAAILGLALIVSCAFLPGGGGPPTGVGSIAQSVFYPSLMIVPGWLVGRRLG